MAYDEALAERVRAAIGDLQGISERKMFGGIAFMAGNNFFVGVFGREIMCRVGAEGYLEALAQAGSREMDITGRPARGVVFVGSPGIDSDADLERWVDQTYAFASTLPAKPPRSMKRPARYPR